MILTEFCQDLPYKVCVLYSAGCLYQPPRISTEAVDYKACVVGTKQS